MKKILFIGLCLLGTALTASAQFKIHSNGKMSFQNPDTTAFSPVSLNCSGDSTIFMKYEGNLNGISCTANKKGYEDRTAGYFESASRANSVGVNGVASTSSSSLLNHYSVGVLGHADNTGWAYSYGVAGTFSADLGAGIYGTSYGEIDHPSGLPTGRYAGYFDCTTKVVGNFYATGSINGTVLLGNSSTSSGLQSVAPLTADRGNVMDMLSRLNAHTYFQPAQAEGRRAAANDNNENVENSEQEPDVIGEQISKKMHYALSADQLEDVFPDLVYTDRNGERSINYVEMVPLLVQCINELNARLSALDGNSAARRESSLSTSADTRVSLVNATLYQNTPNPFTAQTEIRFSLPDDAPQAYIYVFDMNGKMQKQLPVDPSQQSVTVNGYELQAGIYLYSLVVGGQEIDTKRMILSK